MSRSRSDDGTRNTWRSPLQAASEFLASARLCHHVHRAVIGVAAKMTAYTYVVNLLLGRPQGRVKELWAWESLQHSSSHRNTHSTTRAELVARVLGDEVSHSPCIPIHPRYIVC